MKRNKFNLRLLNHFIYVLTVILAFSCFLNITPITKLSSANTNWINYAASSFDKGSGSSSSPYEIATPQQLAYFAKCINEGKYLSSYFKLTKNISLREHQWTPIGTSSYNFKGVFDGNGKTIGELNNTSTATSNGLFAYTNGATIQNLFLISGHLNGSNTYVGALVGSAQNTTIKKIYSTVKITNGASNSYTGGIVGTAIGGSSFEKVINKGEITAKNSYYVGGIGGYLVGNFNIGYNTGKINGSTIDNTDYGFTGGLFGYFVSDNLSNFYTIKNAYNYGTISGKNYIGGIAGGITRSNTSSSTTSGIMFCYNSGEITASSGYYIGGLVGEIENAMILDSYNNAKITADSDVGGIAGIATGRVRIARVSNSGIVNASNYVGGILGYADVTGNISVEESFNEGNITASSGYVGGMVGYARLISTLTIKRCGNTATISAGISFVGGILGSVYTATATGAKIEITENFNSGKTVAEGYIGGIVGNLSRGIKFKEEKGEEDIYFETNGQISYNSNFGILEGDYYVGGIVGFMIPEKVTKYLIEYNYYGGYFNYNLEKLFENNGVANAIYTHLGGIVGADVYHDYSKFKCNYSIIDFEQRRYEYSIWPIGRSTTYYGYNLGNYKSRTIEIYFSGDKDPAKIYVFNYMYGLNLSSSQLGSNFTQLSSFNNHPIPVYARKQAYTNVLNAGFATPESHIKNNGHPILSEFYWWFQGEKMKLFHILFASIVLPLVVVIATLLRKVNENKRIKILYYTSVVALIVHLSLILTTFFTTNFSSYSDSLASTIWPVFPCNLTMWLLPFMFSKYKPIKLLYPFVITNAIIGGLFTILFPNFMSTSHLTWSILRSLISHALQFFIGIFAIVSGEYKPKLKDISVVAIGSVGYILFGYLTIFLFKTFKKADINAMYLNRPAIPNTIFNAYGIAIFYLATCALFFFLYEYFSNKKAKDKN